MDCVSKSWGIIWHFPSNHELNYEVLFFVISLYCDSHLTFNKSRLIVSHEMRTMGSSQSSRTEHYPEPIKLLLTLGVTFLL